MDGHPLFWARMIMLEALLATEASFTSADIACTCSQQRHHLHLLTLNALAWAV
jgi:hypothetical protein